MTLAHPNVGVLDGHFPYSTPWKVTFWIILLGIAIGGYLLGVAKQKKEAN